VLSSGPKYVVKQISSRIFAIQPIVTTNKLLGRLKNAKVNAKKVAVIEASA
jgi:hypothetical protein